MAFSSLSGSDYFHLLIDRKMKRFGLVGNISRVHFHLHSETDVDRLVLRLAANKWLQKASSIRYKLNWPYAPKWVQYNNPEAPILLSNNLAEDAFQSQILNRQVDNEQGLVFVDVCELKDGAKHVVISMHHALFDHQGMMNFIHALNDDFDGPAFPKPNQPGFWRVISDAFTMTLYMLNRSSWKLGSLLEESKSSFRIPKYDSLIFSKEESKQIEQKAWQAGSRIGTSAYLISATAKAVESTLKNRGKKPPYLWFSTPHKQRKIGTKGHLFSNQLSFLFFKLTSDELSSNHTAVASINEQLKQQIKGQITTKYAALMDALRFVPLFLYEQMVDVTSNGKLASFGFSDLGVDQLEMKIFCSAPIVEVFRYPPVPTPPGFNVAAVKSSEQFQFVFGYVDEAMSKAEIETFKHEFKNQLLGNA